MSQSFCYREMGQSHSVKRAAGSEGTEDEGHGNTVKEEEEEEEEEEVAGMREGGGVMRRFRRWLAARAARKESKER